MDFMGETQMQGYETKIGEIEEQLEETNRLEKLLEIENNKIFLLKLTKNKTISKLSQVNVKVFRCITELFNIYDKEIPFCDSLKVVNNKKSYLIEIYLAKVLLQKLHKLQWRLFLTIHYDNKSTNKVIIGTNKLCILDVIPIEEDVLNCIVETNLILELDNQVNTIKLDQVNVDVSYHISSTIYNTKYLSRHQRFLETNKLYNMDIKKYLFPMLTYDLKLHIEIKDFLKMLIKNCYHSVDLEVLLVLESGNKSQMEFTLYYGQQEKYSINFNKNNVVIAANYADLYLLKRYLLEVLHNHEQQGEIHDLNKIEIQNFSCSDINTIKLHYAELRKKCSVLPI